MSIQDANPTIRDLQDDIRAMSAAYSRKREEYVRRIEELEAQLTIQRGRVDDYSTELVTTQDRFKSLEEALRCLMVSHKENWKYGPSMSSKVVEWEDVPVVKRAQSALLSIPKEKP